MNMNVKNMLAVMSGIIGILASNGVLAAEFGQPADGKGVAQTVEEIRQVPTNIKSSSTTRSAINLAYDRLDELLKDKGITEGWNAEKEIYLALGTAIYMSPNPAEDTKFVKMRGLKSLAAMVDAKRTISNFIRTELSPEILVDTPDINLGEELNAGLIELNKKIKDKEEELYKLTNESNALEVNTVGGINQEDLSARTKVQALINYGANNIDYDSLKAEDKVTANAMEDELRLLAGEVDSLVNQIKAYQKSQGEKISSKTELNSAGPLPGAIIVGQYESWRDGKYEIANIVLWSAKQNKLLTNIYTGKATSSKLGKYSLGDYVSNNDWTTVLGNRKFVDDKGFLHIVGVGVWPIIGNSSTSYTAAKGFAYSDAIANIGFVLASQFSASSTAEAIAQEILNSKGDSSTTFADKYVERIKDYASLDLQGASVIRARIAKDPISGQEIYYTVMDYTVNSGKSAKVAEKSLYEGAEEMANANQKSAGVKAGLEESLQEELEDTSEFEEGVLEGHGVVAEQQGNIVAGEGTDDSSIQSLQTQNTTVIGGGVSDDNFDF
jgi:hypothetical protein